MRDRNVQRLLSEKTLWEERNVSETLDFDISAGLLAVRRILRPRFTYPACSLSLSPSLPPFLWLHADPPSNGTLAHTRQTQDRIRENVLAQHNTHTHENVLEHRGRSSRVSEIPSNTSFQGDVGALKEGPLPHRGIVLPAAALLEAPRLPSTCLTPSLGLQTALLFSGP